MRLWTHPKKSTFPKHLLFLRDFTKNSSGVANNSSKSLSRTLATPYFTGSAKRKKKFLGLCQKVLGVEEGKRSNFGKDLLLNVQNRLNRSQLLSPSVFKALSLVHSTPWRGYSASVHCPGLFFGGSVVPEIPTVS